MNPNELSVSFGAPNMAANAIQDVFIRDGQQFIGQYSQGLVENTGGWIDNNLKSLFAVDDAYFFKKIAYLIFPFLRKRNYEIERPDLYIPLMFFLTYVLTAGFIIRSPDQLSLLASSALLFVGLEVGILTFLFYLFNVKCSYTLFQHLGFSGYKFLPMVVAILIGIVFKYTSYLAALGYSTLALGFYTIKSYHIAIESTNQDNFDHKVSRTGVYIVGVFSLIQPLIMFWLSYNLVP